MHFEHFFESLLARHGASIGPALGTQDQGEA